MNEDISIDSDIQPKEFEDNIEEDLLIKVLENLNCTFSIYPIINMYRHVTDSEGNFLKTSTWVKSNSNTIDKIKEQIKTKIKQNDIRKFMTNG